MNKVILYGKAFGIVIKKRWQKRKLQRKVMKEEKWTGDEEKRKSLHTFHVVLGSLAVIAICASGIVLLKTVNRIETWHAIVAGAEGLDDDGGTTTVASKDDVVIREVPAGEMSRTQEEAETIEEEAVPLAAGPGSIDTIDKWQHIDNVSAEASSVLISESDKSYAPDNLLDQDVNTNWQEGMEGNGEGTMLTFSFPETVMLNGFSIVNGNGIAEDKYEANNRVKDITITVAGEQVAYSLEDVFGSQVISFDHAVATNKVVITINSVYEGSLYQDTCMSDIDFYGDAKQN